MKLKAQIGFAPVNDVQRTEQMKVLMLLILLSCGKAPSQKVEHVPFIPSQNFDNAVVLARASFNVTTVNQNAVAKAMNFVISSAYAANPGAQSVTVVLAGNTTMSMSNAAFFVPSITNDVIDFGSLAITALQTNDLKKCGTNGNQKCTKALFRIYTSGKPGAGIWNDTDAYGVPLLASGQETGLGQANSVIAQTITIANTQNTVKLSDFGPAPSFDIKGDFTNAGAGTYSTTINVEFALAP